MKWVVLVVVVCLGGYTFVRLYFNKPTPAYRPYQDSVDHTTVSRLLASGYQRVELGVERLNEPAKGLVLKSGDSAAMALNAPGGLPKELDFALVQKPLLADSYGTVTAAASVGAKTDYRILAGANLADTERLLTSVMLFRKEGDVALVPIFEPLKGKLETRWKECNFVVTIPAGTLPPGSYDAQLLGSKGSRKWTFTVRP